MRSYGAYDIPCTYGRSKNRDTAYVYPKNDGFWYCVDGSVNVNFTWDEPTPGVWVEEINDVDHFTWDTPITSAEMLEAAVDE